MKYIVYTFIVLNIYLSYFYKAAINEKFLNISKYRLNVRNNEIGIANLTKNDNMTFIKSNNNEQSLYSNHSNACVKQYINSNNVISQIFKKLNTRTSLILDYDFAKKLRQAQPNTKVPLVNDIVVSKQNDSYNVYVIINNANPRNESFKHLRSVNVTLEVDGQKYYNIFPEINHNTIRLLKYIVPSMKQSGNVTLYDHATNISYNDLPYKLLVQQQKRKVAVCTYISNYNTAGEVKSWVAFYLLQGVDNVIYYCSVKCDYFKNVLRKEIESGYVIFYDYPWPINNFFGPVVLSVQASQINSCLYRHRDSFEYVIPHDVDEYFYSELYPYDIYKAITEVFNLNPDKMSLAVLI